MFEITYDIKTLKKLIPLIPEAEGLESEEANIIAIDIKNAIKKANLKGRCKTVLELRLKGLTPVQIKDETGLHPSVISRSYKEACEKIEAVLNGNAEEE